jgi:hypothetical protein
MNSHPRAAMEKGFTSQFTPAVTAKPFQCRATCRSEEKSTRSNIGMIIAQMRIATGRLTWATSSLPIAWNTPGNALPSRMPATMQAATHNVR